jgi:hypothetical protein
MLSKYISFKIFIVSFIVGLICVQLLDPERHTIYVYPTPDNYEKIQYRDKSQQCFQFKPVESQCPIIPFSIKTIPVQK